MRWVGRAISSSGAIDDHGRADRQRGDADRVQRVAAEEGEACAEQSPEEVVEPEELAALRRAGAVGELRGGRDERDVPPDAEPEQEHGGCEDALGLEHADRRERHHDEADLERDRPADAVDQRADHEDERVHAEDVRADDREDGVLAVMVVLDDDVAGQVHHRHHHRETRQRCEHRGDDTRTPNELAQRRCSRGRALVAGADDLGDLLRIGADELHHHKRDDRNPSGDEPRNGQGVGLDVLAGEERAEDRRTENRSEDRPEQDVGDAARAAFRWIHVACRRPDQQRDAARRADAGEAQDHEGRRLGPRGESGHAAADDGEREAARHNRRASDAVHQPPRGHRGQSREDEEDRRAETEQASDARHEDERQ